MTLKMNVSRGILYMTFDGVLQPLAYSQVVRPLVGLARLGFRYRLLSVERTKDLADAGKVAAVRSVLDAAGVEWTAVGVDLLGGSARRASESIARVALAGRELVRRHHLTLVHARAYQAATVAAMLRATLGVPYLFDARGYWIEERGTKGDWFGTPARYATGKLVEQHLYKGACGVVTLTALQATDVATGVFGPRPGDQVMVVPTCADYGEFVLRPSRPSQPSDDSVVPEVVRRELRGKRVLGIVGSLNQSYDVEATLALARFACQASADVHLLVLSQQHQAWADAIAKAGIPAHRTTVASAPHDEMATWVQWIDWGLLLLPDKASKRGSMPTKLAEFFASGVRPVAYGCNAEVADWVRRAGSGVVLADLGASSLRAAGARVALESTPFELLDRARSETEGHFSLASGVARYAELLGRLRPR